MLLVRQSSAAALCVRLCRAACRFRTALRNSDVLCPRAWFRRVLFCRGSWAVRRRLRCFRTRRGFAVLSCADLSRVVCRSRVLFCAGLVTALVSCCFCRARVYVCRAWWWRCQRWGGDPGPRAHTSCDSSPTVQPTVAQRSTALPRPAVPAATAHRRHPGREPGLPPPSLALVLPGVRGAPAPRGHGPPSPRLSPAVRGARLPALPRNGGWEAELSRGLAASARALLHPHGGWSGAHGLPRGTPAADPSALRPPASPPPSLTPLAGSLLGATPEPRPSRNLRLSCRGLGLVASEATRRLALSLRHACPLPGDFLVFLLP